MKTYESLANWQNVRREQKHLGVTLGFVPTMGALHKGHLSLIEKAKKENDHVAVSIFVNPTQFNNTSDLEKYPRPLDQDLQLLDAAGVEHVILPNEKELYADQYNFRIDEIKDSKILCGYFRPGHFTGVLTVMMKFLGLARAEKCYMGEKDYQQLHLINQLAKSFFLETQIIPCPTVREESGLALSSRNTRLSPAGREKAALLYKTLCEIEDNDEARNLLSKSGFRVEYLEEHWGRRFVAAWLEEVRLIDNVSL